jgi:hypothetical protein
MSLTNFGEAQALDAILTVTNKWVALFTAAPGEAGGGTEVTGGSYARTAATWAAAAQGAPSTKANNGAITFPVATADWAAGATQITHWAIFDAASAGNMIWYGTIKDATGTTDTPRNVLNGDTFSFASGALVCKMD